MFGCAGSGGNVPVAERGVFKGQKPSHYTVRKGDTLYSIAWRYGMDYKGLAAANAIASHYRISIGQVIDLSGRKSKTPAKPRSISKQKKTLDKTRTVAAKSPSKSSAVDAQKVALKPNETWLWPAKGPLIGTFSTWGKINKGIDIGGHIGDAVRSTRSGKVVYAGRGLLGYGNLVIVKHSEQYLSAYAHNNRILVKEGTQGKAGQKIAEMGVSGNRAKLHFEIRKSGKPINPVAMLSKR